MSNILLEQLFEIVNTKGVCSMSKNEMELVRLIREHDEPEKSLMIAIEVITSFLRQHGLSEEPSAACPQAPSEIGR